MNTSRGAASVLAFALLVGGCARSAPSHVAAGYRGKLLDDTMVEASTTVLVTTRDVVIALDCRPLQSAIANGDAAAIDRFVAAGSAARLPEGVTLYTPPFSTQNLRSAPFVVTDDRYGGILCTSDAFDVLKS